MDPGELKRIRNSIHAHRILILGPLEEVAYEGEESQYGACPTGKQLCGMVLSSIAHLISSYAWTSHQISFELELFLILHRHRPLIVKWLRGERRASQANDVLREFYCISTETQDTNTWWCSGANKPITKATHTF